VQKRSILLSMVVWACCAAWGSGCAAPAAGPGHTALGPTVDLTHTFDADTIFWPTEKGFELERGFSGVTEGGYYYEAHRIRLAEHGGTHLDAPIHFLQGGATVEAVSLSRLIGPASVVDVRAACAANRDYAVGVADLERFEAEHGRLPAGAILLLMTGFSEHWPDRKAYLGTARRGAARVAELPFPGLSPEAARWLVEQREIAAIGLDTASIDPGISKGFEAHRILFAAGVPAFENLTALERLPPTGSTVIALPMKIGGGSGAPLRAIAVLP